MDTIAYIVFGILVLVYLTLVISVLSFLVAGLWDWNYNRKYAAWNELKRTNYERRRPAAK